MGSCCSKSTVEPVNTTTGKNNSSQLTREATGVLSLLSVKTGDSFLFPQIKDIPVLTHTPVLTSAWLPTIEETFWDEKRKLIPDYGVMLKIDQHVLKASNALKREPRKLVEYLIQPCRNDVEKARAVIRWMGEHIQYDTEFLRTGIRGDQSPEAVIISGKAVCEGYSRTAKFLGDLAGLECRGISGQAKGAGYYPGCFNPAKLSSGPGPHAWSAIKIQGKWFLSDATWAAGATVDGVFNKNWTEEYFLSEPKAFVLAHIPLEGDKIIPEDQYLAKPVTNTQAWAENPVTSVQANVYGIVPLTHSINTIQHNTDAELVIKYKCLFPLRHWLSVRKITTQNNTRIVTKGERIDNMVALFKLDKEYAIRCRFQEAGIFEIEVNAHLLNKDNIYASSFSGRKIIAYRIDVGKKCKQQLLPTGFDENWGLGEIFPLSGYQIISPKACVVKAKSGVALVKVKLPTNGVLPNMFKLWHADQDISDYCIVGRRRDMAYYIVQCTKAGEYKLDICIKNEAVSDGYSIQASILIQCNTPLKQPFKVEANRSFLGITEEFLKAGLTTSVRDSILQAKKGQARLRIFKENPSIDIMADLVLEGTTLQETVQQTTEGNISTFNISTPEKKFYILNIFAAPKGAQSYPHVARFGVNNSSLLS